ncbi:MAG: hypothetical protein IBX64_00690 [Actinobacteria bacterium]|nr:hypothetical protein [Actinomycetota bacterium]
MKKVIVISISISIFVFTLLLCQVAYAADLRSGGNIIIPSDAVVNDDLYISGGSVVIDGRVNGDLIIGGGTVTINGSVRDDLMVGSGTVIVNGPIEQSIRVAGGTVSINGEVGEDLVAAGGTLETATDSSVGRDAIITGGNVRLSGDIGRRLFGSVSSLVIDGSIGQNARLYVDRLTLTDRAVIGGDLHYTSENRARIADGAQIEGRTIFDRVRPPAARPGARIATFILSYLAALLFGIVLLLLFPARVVQVADTIIAAPWQSPLLGTALLVTVPVIAIILAVLVVTIPISLTLIFLYILGIYLAKVFVGLMVGRWITGYFKLRIGNIVALLIGLLIIMLLGLIPILGLLLRFLYVLFGLGAAALVLYRVVVEARQRGGPGTEPPEQAPGVHTVTPSEG